MLLREVAVVMVEVATVEVVTAVEGIFTVAAMAGGISVAVDATSAVDRLRGRVFAAIVLSPSITQTPCGR
jgi:hypothetical protein